MDYSSDWHNPIKMHLFEGGKMNKIVFFVLIELYTKYCMEMALDRYHKTAGLAYLLLFGLVIVEVFYQNQHDVDMRF